MTEQDADKFAERFELDSVARVGDGRVGVKFGAYMTPAEVEAVIGAELRRSLASGWPPHPSLYQWLALVREISSEAAE